jgi:histone acetyltransferase (RNA polymerase elongator complex component)
MDQNRRIRTDPDDIRSSVERFLTLTGKKQYVEIAYYGGNFLGIEKKRMISLLDASVRLIDEGMIHGIRFSTRPDTIDSESLHLLKEYPISTIEIGVQSLNDYALTQSQRGHSAENSCHALELLKTHGYRFGVQLMIGLPGDSEAESFKTAEKVSLFSPEFVRIYPTVILKGSLLATWYAKGMYNPLTLDQCISHVKHLFLFFKRRDIPVIRMGLQASETLIFGKDLIAGPFHPAFGHLVLSEIVLDQIISHLGERIPSPRKLCIRTHPNNLSLVKGMGSQNIKKLRNLLDLQSVETISDLSCPLDRLVIDQCDEPVFLATAFDGVREDGLRSAPSAP